MVAGSVRERQGAETRNSRDWGEQEEGGPWGEETLAKGRDGACGSAVRGAFCDQEEGALVSGPRPKDSLVKG